MAIPMGYQVYVAVKHSRHLVNVVMGQVIASDDKMVCYATAAGLVQFAEACDVFQKFDEAEARKKALEEQS